MMRKLVNRYDQTHPDFNDYLEEIFALHKQGWSSVAIANKLNKDHTTVLFHVKKSKSYSKHQGEWPKLKTSIFKTPMKQCFDPQFKTIVPSREMNKFKERLNEGKSYEEYLELAKKKDKNYKHYKTTHGTISE